ncbi:MAG TPA: MFS transporter [Candidatus Dormibacteraeota bacterium]|nr:MFS transporter [Candidatus Dormibacteraeota bacterium]
MRRLWAIRDARLYLAGQGLSILGDSALWLAMAIWVKTLTGSSSAAGLVFFAFAAPQLLGPLSGLLVDRVRRRPLLIAVNLVTGAAVLPLLAVRGAGDVWIVYGVMVVYGAAYTVLDAGQSALLQAALPADSLPDMNGALQSVRQGLRLVGPLLGAGLFVAVGGPAVAVLDAATFLAAAGALALMRVAEPAPAPAPVAARWWSEVGAGARHVLGSAALRQLAVAGMGVLLVLGFSESVIFAVLDRGLHRPPSFVGLLGTAQGAGGLLGGLAAARVVRWAGEGRAFGIGVALFAAASLLMAVPVMAPVFVGFALFGVGLPLAIVGLVTLLQRTTPGHLQGRAYAAVGVMLGVPQTLSIGVGAGLVALVDYRLLLLAMAIVMAGAAAYVLTRPEQRRPARAPAPDAPDGAASPLPAGAADSADPSPGASPGRAG